MMTKKVTRLEAAHNFDALVGTLARSTEPVFVEDDGKVIAVLVGPAQYEEQEWDALLAGIERIHAHNDDKDPDQIEADIQRAVDEVRTDMYGTHAA
jgi:hypothetical protein